jgi:hypothetical protein
MLSKITERIREIRNAFEQENIIELRILGNKSIGEAAYHSDKLFAELSIIAYSLHKMSIKTHITKSPKWEKIKKTILLTLDDAIEELEKKNIPGFEEALENIGTKLFETDKEMGNYVSNLYEKARIKMASSAYGLGLSLSQAAMLTGADKKQLLNYIGITKMHDEIKETKGIASRIKSLKKALEE